MASKLQIAAFSGLLFYVVSNPITYDIVNGLMSRIGIPIAINGKPNGGGLIFHSIVFATITYILMKL